MERAAQALPDMLAAALAEATVATLGAPPVADGARGVDRTADGRQVG
jgi:hypothetical protein